MEDVDSLKLPNLYIFQEKQLTLPDIHFKHSVGGEPIKERTLVQVMYDKNYIVVEFKCMDNPRVAQNHYRENNTPMWNQEVFEIFLAEGNNDPQRYLELEINPNNALFLGWINNADKLGSELKLDFIDIENSGVKWSVEVDEDDNSWSGVIKIPLEMFNSNIEDISKEYRINFFRIISQVDREEEFWEGTPDDCVYGCWNSTSSPEQPCFHRSSYFGRLHLV